MDNYFIIGHGDAKEKIKITVIKQTKMGRPQWYVCGHDKITGSDINGFSYNSEEDAINDLKEDLLIKRDTIKEEYEKEIEI